MSALDRAYIRAYARGPAPQSRTDELPLCELPATQPAAGNGAELESLYAAGSLYRVDWQSDDTHGVPPRREQATPTKRRLRFAQPSAAPTTRVSAPPQKPSGIFRQPLSVVVGKLREVGQDPAPALLEWDDVTEPASEVRNPPLATETAFTPTADEPDSMPPRATAPGIDLTSQVQVTVSAWRIGDAAPAMVVAPLGNERLDSTLAPSLVTQHFDSLSLPLSADTSGETEKVADPEYELAGPAETSPKPITPPIESPVFRLDAARGSAPKPHFGRKSAAPVEPPISEEIAAVETPPITAEIVTASNLVENASAAAEPAQAEPAPASVPLMPMWEVDNFQWPAICERLLAGEQSYFAQSSDKLKSAVLDGLRVLAVAATRRGDGSTTLALCLARSAAAAGLNVAIVDADLTRPELADCLGLEVECGWQAVAAGKAPLAEAAIRSVEDRLTVFPIKTEEKHSLTLADPRAGALLRTIASNFDLVLVDMGPITGGTGPLLPPSAPAPIDAAVVVRDARSVTESSARIVGLKLHAAGIEAVGLAENFGQTNA